MLISTIGFVTGINVVSMPFAKPLMGRSSDRRGRVPFIVGGLSLGGVAIALMPLVAVLSMVGAIIFAAEMRTTVDRMPDDRLMTRC